MSIMSHILVGLRKLFLGKPSTALLTGLALLSLIALLEYRVPNTVEVDLFYFLPILIVTWYHGRLMGSLVSLAGTAVWLTDERVFSPDFGPHLQLYIWNAAIRLGTFLLFVLLLSKIKELLAREKRASALKSQLIRTVSHEFNNALISSYAGLYLLKKTEPETPSGARAQYYEMLDATNEKLKLYVKNILNETRMEDGRFKADKVELDLRDIVNEAAGSMSDVLKQRGQTLAWERPPGPVVVCADREAMALVVGNLLGNAVKYTPQNGRITVRLVLFGDPPGKARLEVKDTGPGIPFEEIKKITAGFYRTAEGRARAEGFGLGLRISNELLALHDSRLEIASEMGRGSSFAFELAALPLPAK
jgi:signal transduction histidine kinase